MPFSPQHPEMLLFPLSQKPWGPLAQALIAENVIRPQPRLPYGPFSFAESQEKRTVQSSFHPGHSLILWIPREVSEKV